jgi:hypothetical protein
MKYTVEVVHVSCYMKFHEDCDRHSGNNVLPQQFERLLCWYYRWGYL